MPRGQRYPAIGSRPDRSFVGRSVRAATAGKQAATGAVRAQAARAKRLSRRARLLAAWQRKADKAVEFALAQRGKPYVWGGTGKHGFDCSGLVQTAWRKAGVQIPRVSYAQYRQIPKRVPKSELRPGDLLFFRGAGHVGMYVGDGKYVHAPSSGRTVTVEKLSERTNYVGAVRPGWPAGI